MIITVDTSVALKWIDTQEHLADRALQLLQTHFHGVHTLAAPFVLYAEVLVALRKWGWSPAQIENGLDIVFSAKLQQMPPTLPLLARAALVAEQTERPRRETFDSIFVAAALMNESLFVTADTRLLGWAQAIPGLQVYHLKELGSSASF